MTSSSFPPSSSRLSSEHKLHTKVVYAGNADSQHYTLLSWRTKLKQKTPQRLPSVVILGPKQVIFLEYVVGEIISYGSSAKDTKFVLGSGDSKSLFDYIAGSERVLAGKEPVTIRILSTVKCGQ